MPKAVIADTSCLIVLDNINGFEILRALYLTVTITPTIVQEFGNPLPDWFIVAAPKDYLMLDRLSQRVDRGEASAITLAIESPDSLLILDDEKARKVAVEYHLPITGTLGLIIKAKQNGIIPSIKPLLSKMKSSGFRITPALELTALQLALEE